ncbi:MAG: aminotransferase class III-fold pyridoxal phosphate-dependent enzyme [Gammaproteobacteria bacterium]|jgi:4-aminobutyrate aminotransferase-like enzyme|nr:aminotransferase class III-fold pyridoxal phosphate-dependent enzyme [Gammaproteobacteria bacterium]
MDSTRLLKRREQSLGAGAELFYSQPIQLVRGQGAHVFDEAGRRYVDFYNNVPAVGHGNAYVADAISLQQRTLNVNSRYLHEGVIAYAERLAALHCPGIESFIFSCSGTEANEVAIQMARLATGRRGVLCTNAAYHGNSDLVGRLTNVGRTQPESEEIRSFPFPDLYRPIAEELSEEELEDAYLATVRQAIERFEASGIGLAAMLVCSIFANEGLPNLPGRFMARAAAMVRDAGGLVIADEVQAGFGRTGHWWGYEATGFQPDIVTMGKPMGNGVPVSATGASRSLIERFRGRTDYFNTYASSPLQAAAGMAVLDVIERDALLDNVRQIGPVLRQGLEQIAADNPHLGDVRGRGLFFVVEVVTDRESRTPDPGRAAAMSDRLKDLGFLTAAAGAYKNLVKVRPPLVLSRDDAAAFLQAFETARNDVCG